MNEGLPPHQRPACVGTDIQEFWEILIPTVRREKPHKPYTTRYHRVWDQKVREITGGLTIFPPAKGQWISKQGALHEERMIPVRIMTSRDKMDQIADFSATYYDQLAIMFYQVGTAVIRHYSHYKPLHTWDN